MYLVYGNVPAVEGILHDIKPAVTAIVVFAAYHIGSRALKNNVLHAMAVLTFITIFTFYIAFPYIVMMAAAIAFIGSRFFLKNSKPVAIMVMPVILLAQR